MQRVMTTQLLTAALFAAPFSLLCSQEITKPTTTTTVARLPAPAKITAVQQPDGRIRVVWSAVEGAASYKLSRSVPPAGIAAVSLTNPRDTGYVDSDVKAGNSYYYLVNAVGESGLGGLKISAPPVAATISAGTSTATTADTANAPRTDSSSVGVTDPKAAVVSATSVKLTWKSAVGATQYRLDRSLGGAAFGAIATLAGTTTSYVDQLVGGLRDGVRYQILSLSPKGSSAPVLFNEIPPAKSAVDTTANAPRADGR